LSKYRKLSIIGGPALYNKGEISPQFGDYSFENKSIWGFNAGIEYDFYPDRKWSVLTGLLVALENVYKIECTFKKEDLYDNFTEDYISQYKMTAMPSLSAPLLMRLNFQIGSKTFTNLIMGLKVIYFPSGSGELSVVFHNTGDTESDTVFSLYAESPENPFQGSFVIGAGLSFAIDKVLLKTNLIYTMNFQNCMEGYYHYENVSSTYISSGEYKLSGNYLGLWISVTMAKKKKRE
jgi:hypothetical protein